MAIPDPSALGRLAAILEFLNTQACTRSRRDLR
jgi:hypothetical protein